jgi:multicomponent K+:H+ antiporter subunit D
MVELVERIATNGQSEPDADGDLDTDEDTNLDDERVPLVGKTVPLSMALLGLAFMLCALLVAGLPPLSGFVAKVALLSSVLNPQGTGATGVTTPVSDAWWFIGLLLFSGVVTTVSLSRTGIRHFWSTGGRLVQEVKVVEAFSVVALLSACVLLSVCADPVLRYTRAAAADLHAPEAYIRAVLSAKPRPGPTRSAIDRRDEGE